MGGPRSIDGPTNVPVTQSAPTEHLVEGGQTLSKIASMYGVSLSALLAANPQFDKDSAGGEHNRTRGERGTWDADHIRVGDKINLPPGARLAGQTPAVTGETGVEETPTVTEPQPSTVTPPVEDGVEEATPNPNRVLGNEETATGVRPLPPEETSTQQPQGPEQAQSADAKKGGVWSFLTKLFSNPIFQGVLAILSAIPGVGQVVSGIGAVIALTMFINSIVQARDGPGDYNWVALGSALLFITGTFIPGAGAFGGILGMAMGPPPEPKKDSNNEQSTGQQPAEVDRQETTDPATAYQPMEPESYDAHLEFARTPPVLNGDRAAAQEWFTSIGLLNGERNRLQAVVTGGQEIGAVEAGRLEELNRYFDTELAQTAVVREMQLAYGIDDRTALETATAGKPYVFPATGNLDAIPGAYGDDVEPAAAMAAFRAYNGLPADALPPAGAWTYMPTAEQVELFTANGRPVTSEVLAGELMRSLKQQLNQLAVYLGQFDSAAAREAQRLNVIIQGMRPGIGPLDSRSQSEPGVEEQPATG